MPTISTIWHALSYHCEVGREVKTRQFVKLASELFGSILRPHGFTCAGSHRAVFHRRLGCDVYHIVLPNQGTRGTWYDIRVFPTSPLFQEEFEGRFPDFLGGTNDVWGHLNEQGVGLGQQTFNCVSEDNMRRGFAKSVSVLLAQFAIPYLDQFTTVESMLPVLRGPFSKFRDL